jgi:hypothetical protein
MKNQEKDTSAYMAIKTILSILSLGEEEMKRISMLAKRYENILSEVTTEELLQLTALIIQAEEYQKN